MTDDFSAIFELLTSDNVVVRLGPFAFNFLGDFPLVDLKHQQLLMIGHHQGCSLADLFRDGPLPYRPQTAAISPDNKGRADLFFLYQYFPRRAVSLALRRRLEVVCPLLVKDESPAIFLLNEVVRRLDAEIV